MMPEDLVNPPQTAPPHETHVGSPAAGPSAAGASACASGNTGTAATGSAQTAAQSPWKAALAWCLARTKVMAALGWKAICDTARYYWGIRRLLWAYLAGLAPNLMPEALRMREVRLAPYESHRFAEFTDESWKVAIPGRCVVCGERTACPQVEESLAIDDAARAFLVPLGTLGVGALLALIYSRWLFLVSIPLGFTLGYLLRTRTNVLLRVVRCEPHANRTNIPQVLVWGSTLVLRFGHKQVRKLFLYGESVDAVVPQPDMPLTADLASPPDKPIERPPETIPLADSPHPDDATIRHNPPTIFGPADEPESPLVP